MSKTKPNQIRAERKRWRLAQNELALLAGLKSRAAVSDAERLLRKPPLELVLACEIVFGKTARVMFPGLFEQMERDILRRADELHSEIINSHGPIAETKRSLLHALSRRGPPNNSNV